MDNLIEFCNKHSTEIYLLGVLGVLVAVIVNIGKICTSLYRVAIWFSKKFIQKQKAEEDDKSGVIIHIDVDADCNLFCFSTFISQLKAGEDNVVYLKPGGNKLVFESAEFPEVKDSKIYEITPGKECDFMEISLKDKVEERRRAVEEEVKRKKEEEHQMKLKSLENIEFMPIQKDGKYGFADDSGKVVIPCQWKKAYQFSEGLARVKDENGNCGYIDKTGKVVIPCQWKKAYQFSEGLAHVEDDNKKWGYIDKTGKVVIPYQWEEASSFSNGLAGVIDDNEKLLAIDKNGKVVRQAK